MRVVLVRLSALGDIVHTWPLAVALRQSLDPLHLTWVVEQGFAPLVAEHPAVDEVVQVATRRWRRRPLSAAARQEMGQLRRRLRALAPDLCIDSQGVFKSALVTRWTAAPVRVGLARPWRRERLAGLAYTRSLPGSTDHPHVVATNLALLRATGQTPPTEPSPPDGRWLLERARADHGDGDWQGRYGVILPGAGWPTKVLPVATLAAVARDLAANELEMVVAWGPGEKERAAAVADHAGAGVTLAPSTGLDQLTLALGNATLVIGGDTGPVHLAASLGVPTVGVFLATNPARNGPLGARSRVVAATAEAAASPTGSAKARRIRDIGSQEILDTARRLLVTATDQDRAATARGGPS
jgi:heptosyltransferase-1